MNEDGALWVYPFSAQTVKGRDSLDPFRAAYSHAVLRHFTPPNSYDVMAMSFRNTFISPGVEATRTATMLEF